MKTCPYCCKYSSEWCDKEIINIPALSHVPLKSRLHWYCSRLKGHSGAHIACDPKNGLHFLGFSGTEYLTFPINEKMHMLL